jgi:putative ABC transport system substrate-binding protein
MKRKTAMWRRTLFAVCVVTVSTCSVLATEVARVGTLFPGSASSTAFAEKAFWARMAELGWHEGENLSAVNLHADGNPDRLSKLVSDLVSARVNVMVIAGTHGAVAAKRATQTIPIVGVLADPVALGWHRVWRGLAAM